MASSVLGFCFLVLLLVFLSLLFNAPTRHTKQLNFYIYISVYCTIINSFCLWLHTKKDLLKLYLLLNYNISDNHSIGQGKIKKQNNKKKNTKRQICLLVTSSVQADPWSFLASFKGFPVPSKGGSRPHLGFALFLLCLRERSQDADAGQFTSVGGCKSAPLPWRSPECSWHCLVPFHLWVGQLESMGVF